MKQRLIDKTLANLKTMGVTISRDKIAKYSFIELLIYTWTNKESTK